MDMETINEMAKQIAVGAVSSIALSSAMSTETEKDCSILVADALMETIDLCCFMVLTNMLRIHGVVPNEEARKKAAYRAREAALAIVNEAYTRETCHVNN